MSKKILIINGSIRGKEGNSRRLAQQAKKILKESYGLNSKILTLSHPKRTIHDVYDLVKEADGFLVLSGTYWNNMSSLLQRFIETMSIYENNKIFFGKPLACAVTMDSVGGVDVGLTIQNSFAWLWCRFSPCSSIVVSRLAQSTLSEKPYNKENDDVWTADDLQVILKNLVAAAQIDKNQRWSWSYNLLEYNNDKRPETGDLNLHTPLFIE